MTFKLPKVIDPLAGGGPLSSIQCACMRVTSPMQCACMTVTAPCTLHAHIAQSQRRAHIWWNVHHTLSCNLQATLAGRNGAPEIGHYKGTKWAPEKGHNMDTRNRAQYGHKKYGTGKAPEMMLMPKCVLGHKKWVVGAWSNYPLTPNVVLPSPSTPS